MAKIAQVVVDTARDREFSYVIPEPLAGSVHVGSRVHVPFGRTHADGYVVRVTDRSDRMDLKPIESVQGRQPYISQNLLRLAEWMADYYCAPRELVLRTILPAAVRRKDARFKTRSFVSCVEGADAEARLPPKQAAALQRLRSRDGMFLADLLRETGTTASPVHSLVKKGLVQLGQKRQRRDPGVHRTILPTQPLDATAEQKAALVVIREVIDREGHRDGESRVVLLHGVTGSGKTEVYLQAIDHAMKGGKGAIVLVPEISLTPQTVERFVSRFGERIAVLHSHLSDGERHDEWHRIRDGHADIVVGARSAVFAPVRNPGLIVVDEEHEPSYKQEETPRYGARDVAVMRGSMEDCCVVLGSATPSLESWCNVRKGKYLLANLTQRVDGRRMPSMQIVDMRIETERSGHVSVFSRDLLEAMRLRLERGEQTMLFLNRRGYSTSLICPKCGHVARCDSCSVSYTYHRSGETLRCHICGSAANVPPKCPSCGDPAFRFTGVGTQRVESIVRKCFPQACVQRMDADMTTTKDAYDRILGDFRAGKTNILIGTQMIAKGLHFPNVTLVGVVYADLSLHMPDFRAGERTFQLLAQVAGRAGRGEVAGEVIVQTYTPFHVAVQAARRLDYETFSDQEMEFRKQLLYPPFGHLVCITLRGASEGKVSFHAAALAARIKEKMAKGTIVSEAAPAPLAKAKGNYRYQVMLRSASTAAMTRPLRECLKDFVLPKDVVCTVDVDALSLM